MFAVARSLSLFGSLRLRWIALGACAAVAAPLAAWGAVPSDVLLPRSTKGYVSVARPAEFNERWQYTQLGQMMADDVMQPFAEDLRSQLQNKFRALEDKLGLTWDDLRGVPAGELSFAILERPGQEAALAITIDVTGRRQEADGLLAAVERRLAARGARRQIVESGGTPLLILEIPGGAANQPPQQTVYFIRDDTLVGVDDRAEAEAMLRRFADRPEDNLASIPAYAASMQRCAAAANGLAPEARWFIEPFGLIRSVRTLRENNTVRPREDYARIFAEQGFDAIQGAGGFVNLLAEGHIEILHRTSIFAPPAPGKENDPLRWNLSMRMLQLPNTSDLSPQSWVPRMSAGYSTFSLRVADAFDNLGPIFDALRDHRGAFETTLEGWEVDAHGPQVNVRQELIAHLGNRITIVTDYRTPISVDSERSVFAIEAANEQLLATTLSKWMSSEPDWERREFNGIVIWERVPPAAVGPLPIDVPGFGAPPGGATSAVEDDRETAAPEPAACVALGHLLVASDIEFLKEILIGFGQRERLATGDDFEMVMARLDRQAAQERSGLSFARTDETVRPSYELLRQGRMPESETMFGRLLNDLLTSDVEEQEGIRRKQKIDGSSLPNFETVRRYFGPSGRILRSERDGWMLTGVLLNKESP